MTIVPTDSIMCFIFEFVDIRVAFYERVSLNVLNISKFEREGGAQVGAASVAPAALPQRLTYKSLQVQTWLPCIADDGSSRTYKLPNICTPSLRIAYIVH